MPARSHYDPDTQARAVRMYADRLEEADGVSKAQARREIGEVLGINPATLKNWIVRDLEAPGHSPVEVKERDTELAELKAENARLKRANEILRTSSAFFRRSGARPQTRTIIAYIRQYRHRFGVEPIWVPCSASTAPRSPRPPSTPIKPAASRSRTENSQTLKTPTPSTRCG